MTYDEFFEQQRQTFERFLVAASNDWAVDVFAKIEHVEDGTFRVTHTHIDKDGKVGNTPAPNIFEAQRLLAITAISERYAVNQELEKVQRRNPHSHLVNNE